MRIFSLAIVSAALMGMLSGCAYLHLEPGVYAGVDGRRWAPCAPRTIVGEQCLNPANTGGPCPEGTTPIWSGDEGCGPDGRRYLD